MQLTQKRLKELLSYDIESGNFIWNENRRGGARKGDVAGRTTSDGYIEIRVDGGFYRAHRLALLYMHGVFDQNLEVDHINRVKHDNRLVNLRLVTSKQNKENVGLIKNSKAGLLGVSWSNGRNKWLARICHDGVRHYLGIFTTPEEAHEVYLAAKQKLHTFSAIQRETT